MYAASIVQKRIELAQESLGFPLVYHSPADIDEFSPSQKSQGAVLNGEFDCKLYLAALAADGLNLTRTFAGTYREIPESFGIENNTLLLFSGDNGAAV